MFKQTLTLLVGMFLAFALSASGQATICESVTLLDAQASPRPNIARETRSS